MTPQAFRRAHIFAGMASFDCDRNSRDFLQQVLSWVEFTAFLPNPFLFSVVWEKLIDRLRGAGFDQFVDYLVRAGKVIVMVDGKWCAAWWSGDAHIQPGFSTYAQNALESFWRLVKRSFPRQAKVLNVLPCLRKVSSIVEAWILEGKWSGVVGAPNLHHLQANAMHGAGINPRSRGMGRHRFAASQTPLS